MLSLLPEEIEQKIWEYVHNMNMASVFDEMLDLIHILNRKYDITTDFDLLSNWDRKYYNFRELFACQSRVEIIQIRICKYKPSLNNNDIVYQNQFSRMEYENSILEIMYGKHYNIILWNYLRDNGIKFAKTATKKQLIQRIMKI